MSEDGKTLYGYYRSPNDSDQWIICYDEETALDAEPGDFIYGETREEVINQLNAMYPAVDPRLSRVISRTGWYDTPSRIIVDSDDKGTYRGGDTHTAVALAKEYGSIKCTGLTTSHPFDWAEHGCIIRTAGRYWGAQINSVTYDRAAVKRARKSSATREARAPVSVGQVGAVVQVMQRLLNKHVHAPFAPGSSGTRYWVARQVVLSAQTFEMVFGKHSYRRLKEFRKLKDEWKKRQKQTEQVFLTKKRLRSAAAIGLCPELVFCRWMADEAQARNVKLRDEKDFTPLRKERSFAKEFRITKKEIEKLYQERLRA